VLTACAIAVCLFNGGAKPLQAILRGLNLEVGEHCTSGFTTTDQQRLDATAEKSKEAT